MFLPSQPLNRHRKAALTILESLILLITATLLTIVAVPVALVKYGYIKHEATPLVTSPPSLESTGASGLRPVPRLSVPEAPKLPAADPSISK